LSQFYIFVIAMAAAIVGGTLVAVGAAAWPLAWLGLELNLLGFVPLVMLPTSKKKAAISYFVVQSVGSLLLLYGGLSPVRALMLLAALGLLLKIGLAPLHF